MVARGREQAYDGAHQKLGAALRGECVRWGGGVCGRGRVSVIQICVVQVEGRGGGTEYGGRGKKKNKGQRVEEDQPAAKRGIKTKRGEKTLTHETPRLAESASKSLPHRDNGRPK